MAQFEIIKDEMRHLVNETRAAYIMLYLEKTGLDITEIQLVEKYDMSKGEFSVVCEPKEGGVTAAQVKV